MKKLMEFNKEAGEKRKEQIQKAQDELQKSVDGADRKVSSYYLEYRNGSISQVTISGNKEEAGRKKGTGSANITVIYIQSILPLTEW